MPAKSKKQRAAEQRDRQQGVRDKAKQTARPSRDDIARMFLWRTISDAHRGGEEGRLLIEKMANLIVAGLTRQGFDERESYDVFDALVRKYASDLFPFRPKPHLGDSPVDPAT